MRIKSYFANRVEIAVERAQRELGEEAVLLSTRHTEGETRELGKYEVVFGTNESEDAPDTANEIGNSPEDEFLERELAAIGDSAPGWDHPAPVAVSAPAPPARPQPAPTPRPARITAPAPAEPIGPPGVLAVVGPGGAGKTSALMKLAFILSAVRGARIRIVQLDTDRLAALEPMRTFCELLDVPLLLRDSISPADLLPSVESEYVLVDTPGFAPCDGDAPVHLARLFRAIPNLRTHMVLPAWFAQSELPAVRQRFAPFEAGRLIVTRADEVSGDSLVASLASSCSLPISLVSASRHPSAGFANAPQLIQLSAVESAA